MGTISTHHYIFLTLFPDLLQAITHHGLLGRARIRHLVSTQIVPLRNYAPPPQARVDDAPYGGGAGMVLRFDVLHGAWQAIQEQGPTYTILLSPQGKVLTQERATELTHYPRLLMVCGHYEGVDERFIEHCVDEEISIGDYVLSGGELAAGVVVDAVVRSIPEVLRNPESYYEDCFQGRGLKYAQYTRPATHLGQTVPEVLLSGDHQAIASYREAQRSTRTARKRPDLLCTSFSLKANGD